MAEESLPQQPTPENPEPPKEVPSLPVETTIVPAEKPKRVWIAHNKGNNGTLDRLPDEVKRDMERFMIEKSAYACQKYMAEKYGKKHPELITLKYGSYMIYKRRHKERIVKELALAKQIAEPMQEVQGVINAITDPDISLDDKRKALNALYNVCEARRTLLTTRQDTFLDPDIESLILANVREQRTIIEKVAILNEQLSKESDKDFLGELESYTSVVLSAVFSTFKTVCGETNFSHFKSTLDETLTATLRTYASAKERLKSDKK